MTYKIGEMIPCGSTRNFKAGNYLMIGGGIGVSRSEAEREKENTPGREGFEKFVHTLNEDEGHAIILVPNSQVKK